MTDDEYGLTEETAGAPGDEFEEIDVRDTEADKIARTKDREFAEFRKRLKDTEQFKLDDGAFDDATYAAIYKLVEDDHVGAMGGPISTGKEANVYEALDAEGGDVALKVYRINASNFQQMRAYLEGDPRFEVARRQEGGRAVLDAQGVLEPAPREGGRRAGAGAAGGPAQRAGDGTHRPGGRRRADAQRR